jgi:hypothetical protein
VLDRTRTATGDRLVYHALKETYELTGTTAAPVKLLERQPPDCKESTGLLLTYYKPTGSISIDGKSEVFATVAMKPCATTPAR